MKFTSAIAILITFSAAPVLAQSARRVGFEISTLSARADKVSGGDVLIRIVTPASAANNVAITVNGHAAQEDFKPTATPTTLIVRLKDLQLGKNTIEVGVKGQRPAVQLLVVNHPISGPVMSGPHQTPFKCETQAFGFGPPLDADCTVATRVEYLYRSTTQPPPANPFRPYDANAPKPADLGMTTTLDGKTVPYIVRREMGTINRAVYAIAFLHEPGTPLPDPWNTGGTSWNLRLIYR